MENREIQLPIVREDVPVIRADVNEGLSSHEVELRRACGWQNRTSDGAVRSEKEIILHHIFTFFNLVFIVLAVVLLISGSSVKNMTFLVIVVVNTVIGIIQEIRAKREVEKLTLVAAHPVPTVRDGKTKDIPSQELVRDDIVIFSAGSQICADAVLRSGSLQVNESLITGEADAVNKEPGDALMSGSFVIAGRGKAQLTQVGDDAFAAKLSAEAKADPKAAKSEMMKSLDKLIRVIGFALIPVGIVLFCQHFYSLDLSLRSSSESTVAALVGMIPEGLYLLTSVALAVSAIKLSRQQVLVQDMNCIETLARVDVLCVDKTGTITEPKMEVENIVPLTKDSPEFLETLLTALYGETEPENDTGKALHEVFSGESGWVCTQRIPFTSQTKWMGCVFEGQGAFLAGAPEYILGDHYAALEDQIDPWTASGYRVLLIARYDDIPDPKGLTSYLVTPLALLLLTNRVRPSAPDTFRYFKEQGVAVKVISGDHPAAVSDVARRAGIEGAESYMDATALETWEDCLEAVQICTVFGRVTPDKKKMLIQALRAQGHTVAMTGDGVNDVLAMKEADCGIAMASGADAACHVAQMVMLDSDFSAMPDIVGEGRRVINNIQRAATLFLVKNIFSLGLALISLLTGWSYPLKPIHLTIISSLTIGVPSFFLAMEPNYERVEGKFLPSVLRRAFPGGLTNIFVVLAAQIFMVVFHMTPGQTATICTAILAIVGMQVLFQVCKPFDKFRIFIWWAMAACLVLCFTVLNSLLELQTGDSETLVVMLVLMIMSPTVFFAVQRIFDFGDRVWAKLQARKKQ